jgi:hypothetical protein
VIRWVTALLAVLIEDARVELDPAEESSEVFGGECAAS